MMKVGTTTGYHVCQKTRMHLERLVCTHFTFLLIFAQISLQLLQLPGTLQCFFSELAGVISMPTVKPDRNRVALLKDWSSVVM